MKIHIHVHLINIHVFRLLGVATQYIMCVTAYPQVYLVDYGLAFRYISDGKHKEYKEDPKRAHDGTVEFTSRDAHKGVGMCTRHYCTCTRCVSK